MPLPVAIALCILGPIWLAVLFWFGWLWHKGNWYEDKPVEYSTSRFLGRHIDLRDSSVGLAANSDEQLEYRAIKHSSGGIE